MAARGGGLLCRSPGMSLAAFQLMLARLTASPALVNRLRADPAALDEEPDLTALERRRLIAIAHSRGMEANCMLYRANRLAPLALNCPETLEALGEQLEARLSTFWASEPETHVNFLVETDRFCRWLARQPAPPAALAGEHALVAARLAETRRLAGGTTWREAPSPSPA